MALSVTNIDNSVLWHKRLGHPSVSKMGDVQFPGHNFYGEIRCDHCICANQPRISFPIIDIH